MDPNIQATIDDAINRLKAKQASDLETQKAQLRQEAQAEIAAYIKSQFQTHFGV